MPRLSYSLLRHSRSLHPLLPLLLKPCRHIQSARNELRWLQEHVNSSITKPPPPPPPAATPPLSSINVNWRRQKSLLRLKRNLLLRSMIRQRSVGKPLQYILGSQPFGQLDILCREGVLIPRPDTENWVHQTAQLITHTLLTNPSSTRTKSLHLIDLCTGTGCIPLLLHSLLTPILHQNQSPFSLSIDAIDIDSSALRLARDNIEHNISHHLLPPQARDQITLRRESVFDLPSASWLKPSADLDADAGTDAGAAASASVAGGCDQLIILTSNPPYISPRAYADGTTSRSVRLYEPKKALVPPPPSSSSLSGDYEDRNINVDHRQQQQQQQQKQQHVQQADLFYTPLINTSLHLNAHLTVLECGDPAQARRVACLAADAIAAGDAAATATADDDDDDDDDDDAKGYGDVMTQLRQRKRDQRRAGWKVERGSDVRVEIWRCDGEGLPIGCGNDDDDGREMLGSFGERWCSIAMDGEGKNGGGIIDEKEEEEEGARVVVLRRAPFN